MTNRPIDSSNLSKSSWIIHEGNIHVTNDRSTLLNARTIDQMMVTNGENKQYRVEAIGDVRLKLNDHLTIHLNDVHYVPEANYNMICAFVRQIADKLVLITEQSSIQPNPHHTASLKANSLFKMNEDCFDSCKKDTNNNDSNRTDTFQTNLNAKDRASKRNASESYETALTPVRLSRRSNDAKENEEDQQNLPRESTPNVQVAVTVAISVSTCKSKSSCNKRMYDHASESDEYAAAIRNRAIRTKSDENAAAIRNREIRTKSNANEIIRYDSSYMRQLQFESASLQKPDFDVNLDECTTAIILDQPRLNEETISEEDFVSMLEIVLRETKRAEQQYNYRRTTAGQDLRKRSFADHPKSMDEEKRESLNHVRNSTNQSNSTDVTSRSDGQSNRSSSTSGDNLNSTGSNESTNLIQTFKSNIHSISTGNKMPFDFDVRNLDRKNANTNG